MYKSIFSKTGNIIIKKHKNIKYLIVLNEIYYIEGNDNMQLIKTEKKYWGTVLCGSEKVNAEGDIIVPDVKPDILKILQIDARSVVTDKGVAIGGIYVQGKIYVNILYVTDGEKSETDCIKTVLDFRKKIDNPKITSDIKLKMSSDVASIDFILLNSRKLSVKTTVKIDYDLSEQRTVEIPDSIEGWECVKKTIVLDTIGVEEECGFTVQGSMEVPSGKPSIRELVKTDTKILEKEIKALEGKIIVSGRLGICALYFTQDKSLDYCEGEIEFTEVFNIEDLSENDFCGIDLTVGEIDTQLSADSDSDIRIIDVECVIEMGIRTRRKEEIEYVCDCYCPAKNTKLQCSDIELREYVNSFKKETNERIIMKADENYPEIYRVYNIVAEPEITKCTTENGGVSVSGKVGFYILYLTNNPECAAYSLKKDVPFEHYHQCEKVEEGMDCDIDITIENLSYNLNSKGEIEIKYALIQEGRVTRNVKLNIICDAEEEDKCEDNDIVIYFVRKGDSLWEIGKKYGVRVEDIIKVNNLDNDIIIEGQKLLIPLG